ncbi:MAG: alpha/beta fold hydrolase [Pseudomonadota bacterium]
MQNGHSDHNRLRSLIFESIARSDTFGDLIEQTDSAMRLETSAGLRTLASEFDDASDAMMRTGAYGKGETDIRFDFDAKGRVTTGTASSVSVFGLEPGQDLLDRVGDSGRAMLRDLLGGRRSQASFTLFTYPNLRPVPVLAQAAEGGVFQAIAISLRWSSAIAPLLRAGYDLTDAEIDVLEMLFRGNQPKDIASARGRSLETVRTQVRNICRKTDTHGQVDIVHLVYGLIATTQSIQADQMAAAHGSFNLTLPSGRRMDVECTGPDTGKPLLFLHGCLAGRRLPDAALKRFANRRIIAPGRPGHGQTPADDSLDLRDIVADLIAVLDYFGVGAIDVLTYDLGAPYGLWMAAIAPDRVTSLNCLAPVPALVDWKDIWTLPVETRVFSVLSRVNPSAARYLALLGGQRILRQGPAGFGKIVFANSHFDRMQVDDDKAAQRMFWHGHAWHVERGPHGFLADATLSSTGWHDRLPPLRTTPRFLVGAQDRNTPRGGIKRLARQVSAEIYDVPDAGHSLLHAAPNRWLDKINL